MPMLMLLSIMAIRMARWTCLLSTKLLIHRRTLPIRPPAPSATAKRIQTRPPHDKTSYQWRFYVELVCPYFDSAQGFCRRGFCPGRKHLSVACNSSSSSSITVTYPASVITTAMLVAIARPRPGNWMSSIVWSSCERYYVTDCLPWLSQT